MRREDEHPARIWLAFLAEFMSIFRVRVAMFRESARRRPRHRFGQRYCALGVAVSFVPLGCLSATDLGFAIEIDDSVVDEIGSRPRRCKSVSAAAADPERQDRQRFRGYPAAGALASRLGSCSRGLESLASADVGAVGCWRRAAKLQQVALTMAVLGLGPRAAFAARRLVAAADVELARFIARAGKRVKQALGVLLIALGVLSPRDWKRTWKPLSSPPRPPGSRD